MAMAFNSPVTFTSNGLQLLISNGLQPNKIEDSELRDIQISRSSACVGQASSRLLTENEPPSTHTSCIVCFILFLGLPG